MKSIKQFLKLRYLIAACLAVVFAFTLWFGAGKNVVPANAAAIVEYKDEAIYKVGNSFRDKNMNYLLKQGETATFTASGAHYSDGVIGCDWRVSNSSILQITGSRSGTLTQTVRGVRPGVATLTGAVRSIYIGPNYTYDDRTMDNPFPIRVVAPLSGATLSQTEMTLAPGATGKIDLMTITPDSAYSLFVTDFGYTSSDSSVATIDATGNIQAIKNGTTTLSFTGDGNVLASCVLTVSDGSTPPEDAQNPQVDSQKSNNAAKEINKATVISLTLPGKRKLKVQIVRDKKADGYQLQYSTKKKFKKKTTKTININKNKKTTKILKKLKSGKKYYIRVRSFKKIRSNNSVTKVYGSWSDVMVSKKIK